MQEGVARTIFSWDAIKYYFNFDFKKNAFFKLPVGGKSGKCVTLAIPEKYTNAQMLFVRS